MPRRILLISNGNGEDSVGASIARHLKGDFDVEAYPTLGPGAAYSNICPIVGPRAHLASEGSRYSRSSIWQDATSGGAFTIFPGLAFLRQARHRYDRVVVVGDMVGVLGCFFAGISGVIWADIYHTGAGRLYSGIERVIVRRTCRKVFNRAETLATALRRDGVDAQFAGNIILDAVSRGDYDASGYRRDPHAILLLPGSRATVASALSLQLQLIALLPKTVMPDLFIALGPSVDTGKLAASMQLTHTPASSGRGADDGQLHSNGLTLKVVRGALGNLLELSDVVLSQAGTATVQAIGAGRPVITFARPDDRPRRVRNESALFGEAWMRIPPDAAQAAQLLARLLSDDAERTRLGSAGRQRVGPGGAMPEILGAIRSSLTSAKSSALRATNDTVPSVSL